MTTPEAGSRIPGGLFGSRTSLRLLTKLIDVLMINQALAGFLMLFLMVPLWTLSLEVSGVPFFLCWS